MLLRAVHLLLVAGTPRRAGLGAFLHLGAAGLIRAGLILGTALVGAAVSHLRAFCLLGAALLHAGSGRRSRGRLLGLGHAKGEHSGNDSKGKLLHHTESFYWLVFLNRAQAAEQRLTLLLYATHAPLTIKKCRISHFFTIIKPIFGLFTTAQDATIAAWSSPRQQKHTS